MATTAAARPTLPMVGILAIGAQTSSKVSPTRMLSTRIVSSVAELDWRSAIDEAGGDRHQEDVVEQRMSRVEAGFEGDIGQPHHCSDDADPLPGCRIPPMLVHSGQNRLNRVTLPAGVYMTAHLCAVL